MKLSLILSVLLATFGIYPLSGQADQDNKESSLSLRLNNINFIKNNEYSNPVTEGYTLIGYFLQPEMIYKVDEKLILSLGANLLSYAGTNRFTTLKPVFSTTFRFTENSYFRIGTLNGADDHRLADPHFNAERLYTNHAEDGLQFRINRDRIFNDTWLSWENYIFRNDNKREIFTAGESFCYSSPEFAGRFRIDIPVQVLVKHFGGQISNYPEHVETFVNLAAGIRAGMDIGESDFIRTGVEYTLFSGSSLTGNASSGIKNGYAGFLKLFYSYKSAMFEAGYWHSEDYYAPDGNFIFSSVSDHSDNTIISERNLLTCSFSITLPWKEYLIFRFGFDGYYDPDLKRFDNALSLHLRFDKLVSLLTMPSH